MIQELSRAFDSMSDGVRAAPAATRCSNHANLNDIKDTSKEYQQCTIEASNIASNMDGPPWFTAFRALNIENEFLGQYKQALEHVQLRSKAMVQRKMKRQLVWEFSKAEVAKILVRMEHLKSQGCEHRARD